MRRFLMLLGTLALASTPLHASSPDFFWGQVGHRIIARVAASRISPETRRVVKMLLNSDESMASVSTWADEVRSAQPETGPWHYVNIPIWDSLYRPDVVCRNGDCVIAALDRYIAILGDRSNSRSVRADALKFVIHFVGDMHQPMHVGDRGDRGGNDVKVTYRGRDTNLHSVWDSGLLGATGISEEQYVVQLERTLRQRGDLQRLTSGTTLDWAMESFQVSKNVVYPFLPRSLELDDDYLTKVQSIMTDRLLRGGARLAAVLDRALAKG